MQNNEIHFSVDSVQAYYESGQLGSHRLLENHKIEMEHYIPYPQGAEQLKL